MSDSSGSLGTYSYDGDGKRVKKVVGTETTIFVYDAGGKMVAEYATTLSTTPQVSYLTMDNLGTPRINTNANGAVIARHDYMPFGEEIDSTVTPVRDVNRNYGDEGIKQKFTGYERDTETDLDYAKARYYAKNHGRFTTTDPLLSSGKLSTPQTWNRYTYTINNPLRFVDPNGLCSAPSGLQVGQVGICFEAFIATSRVGGPGVGDGRTFSPDDASKTARVTVWAIISTDTEKVYKSKTELISPSEVAVSTPVEGGFNTAKTGEVSDGKISAQGTATTDVQLSNINSKQGEKGFGAGIDVTVSIANGANGFQAAAQDIQNVGRVVGGIPGTALLGAGKVGEALAPAGTIDGSATIRITGNGNVTNLSANGRPFPSYAGYTYTKNSEGTVISKPILEQSETKLENLTKPVRPFPVKP